jgi:Mn-dependent DtxR family transcriptional regulator
MTKLLLPKSAFAHHLAALGKTGSGKTSVIKAAIVEPALAAEERVCVIDPTGAWWGLRLKADGRTKGFPVYVFGGRYADYPLLGSSGEAMADVIGTTNTPAILDTSLMKGGDRIRFFTDFADAILRKNEGPLRLVIDEAHVFMPQAGARGGGAVPDMMHAGNNLISLGRSRGLRIVLISQRAAKLHKDSLTQVETLIALRLIAPQDRAAVREWIADQADLEKGKDIIASLPKLNDGEGWVWAPEADFLKRIQFPRPLTFDSSAAPTKNGKLKKLAAVDLKALEGRLAKIDAENKEKDPTLLRAALTKVRTEKAALERQMATAVAQKVVADPGALKKAEERGFDRAVKKFTPLRAALEAAMKFIVEISTKDFFKNGGESLDKKAIEKVIAEATQHVTKLIEQHLDARGRKLDTLRRDSVRLAARFKALIEQLDNDVTVKVDVRQQEPFAIATSPAPRPVATKAPRVIDGDITLTNPQASLLQALAWWKTIGHEQPSRAQLAGKLGWKPTGSNIKDRLSELTRYGLVVYPRTNAVQLTEAGERAAPAPDLSVTLLESIRATLTGPQLAVFDALREIDGEITRDELAEKIGWQPGGSNIKDRLSELSRLELVEYPTKGVTRLQGWVVEQQRAAA